MYLVSQSSSSLLSLLLVLLIYYTPTLVSCTESEVQALLAWRSSLKHPGNLTKMWSYNVSADPCNWDGITCNRHGRITEVYYYGYPDSIDGTLAKFNFSSLPKLTRLQFTENQNLHGEIPDEIGTLHNLQVLDLSDNNLTGQIPRAILNLSNIETLDLSGNELTGEIPDEIGTLHNLQDLVLSFNNLTGQIPRSIRNLSNIETLYLSGNYLTGEIPDEIGTLSKLKVLLLSSNFNGKIPRAIINLSNIEELSLEGNNLTGEIPEEIGALQKLWSLRLSDNSLTGQIPRTIFNLSNIIELDLSGNKLTGKFPEEIGTLHNLQYLFVSGNNLTGSLSPYLGSNNSALSQIGLSFNSFIGTIPPSICKGGNLQYFFASNNNFNNLLPNTFQNCTSLEVLDLGSNNIKAEISHILRGHPNLRYVDFSRNKFYGRLLSNLDGSTTSAVNSQKGFSSMNNLQVFNMDNNNLTGEIPSELTNLPLLTVLILSNNKFSTLQMINAGNLSTLHLNNNELVGGFPLLSRNWTYLITLNLGENNFFGEIPSWIGFSFPNLKILVLRSNQFNGTIPTQLSKFNNLQLLDLSNNNLTGPIPNIFSYMTLMAVRTSSSTGYINNNRSDVYRDNIDVVWKGEEVAFEATLALLTGIDLSCNSLWGEISEDLMKLEGLNFLNLSRNQLNGVIPYNIGNLTWLEVLDLSMNRLTGTIPPSVSHLTHLDVLNLSHNNLTGQIPIGPQIQSFNPSMFSDNDGLCGSPLPNNCSTNNSLIWASVKNGGDEKLERIWIICYTILGFITGFWIYFCALFWKPSVRFAIFRFTDKLQEK